jgi:hypothetical protein
VHSILLSDLELSFVPAANRICRAARQIVSGILRSSAAVVDELVGTIDGVGCNSGNLDFIFCSASVSACIILSASGEWTPSGVMLSLTSLALTIMPSRLSLIWLGSNETSGIM